MNRKTVKCWKCKQVIKSFDLTDCIYLLGEHFLFEHNDKKEADRFFHMYRGRLELEEDGII